MEYHISSIKPPGGLFIQTTLGTFLDFLKSTDLFYFTSDLHQTLQFKFLGMPDRMAYSDF